MDLQIRIERGAVDDYVALADWLNGNRDFRGRVRQVTGSPADGSLGGNWVDMLTVAVGSGGFGVALTNSLNKWLETARADLVAKTHPTFLHLGDNREQCSHSSLGRCRLTCCRDCCWDSGQLAYIKVALGYRGRSADPDHSGGRRRSNKNPGGGEW